MNLSNKLTIFRLVLILPIVILLLLREYSIIPISYYYGFNISISLLFLIACLTDYYDGKIARERNEITDFGKIFDPLADKLLVFAVLITLVSFRKMDVMLVIILLAREFYISGYRNLFASKGKGIIQADVLGKYKTILQMCALLIILGLDTSYNLSCILIFPSVVLSLISAFDYVKNNPLK